MTLYTKENPTTIKNLFNRIANKYDFTNAVMSFQLHKYWNSQLVKHVIKKGSSHTYLDLCCGTGDIALNYIKKLSHSCHVYLIDFCSNMLTSAKGKMSKSSYNQNHHLYYLEADAQNLPLPSDSLDCITIAYGIRNIQSPEQCIKEAFRTLKSSGCLGILELTKPTKPLLRKLHSFYLKKILPLIGKMLTKDQDAYNYLQNSIQSFIAPSELKKIMENHHFKNIKLIPLTGGIATLIIGYKE